ncbi:hypothetical protein [Acinetobacter courvalinii]|uniref:hypothetical protein n=1 Tax=Acinetobacter courvalinii TaxID=280147 RepID=UPI0002D0590B|nr:hypothetical protein [Acinetobacter courvalinii]ENX05634.1 hypothetical protein F898_02578 [Acinetobacter courvalinii]
MIGKILQFFRKDDDLYRHPSGRFVPKDFIDFPFNELVYAQQIAEEKLDQFLETGDIVFNNTFRIERNLRSIIIYEFNFALCRKKISWKDALFARKLLLVKLKKVPY